MRTSGRTVLITASIGVHLAVGFAFFVSSVWKIERIEAGNRPFNLAVTDDPPPDDGSPEGSPAPEFKQKKKKEQPPEKKIVDETVQPTETKKPDPSEAAKAAFSDANASAGGNGLGSGAGDGSGNGRGSGSGSGSGSGDGNGSGGGGKEDPCKKAQIVPPTVLRGLRTSGETQIHPPDVTKTEIIRSGKTQVTANFRVCVGIDGNISELRLIKSSGFDGYDAALTSGLRAWKYKPYMIDRCGEGLHPVPVCATVTFIYGLH
jgi:outer membrane biosynthesis protein TonB